MFQDTCYMVEYFTAVIRALHCALATFFWLLVGLGWLCDGLLKTIERRASPEVCQPGFACIKCFSSEAFPKGPS